ncbi:hypothetical protein ABW21_db0207844 [Orbilia brochopaga]|nr:hypothetical protein ABW21_db0207844 [Drechslerella brochopaga]
MDVDVDMENNSIETSRTEENDLRENFDDNGKITTILLDPTASPPLGDLGHFDMQMLMPDDNYPWIQAFENVIPTSNFLEEDILQTDVLSMLQPEDIDPALLDANFEFDFTIEQPHIQFPNHSLQVTNPSTSTPSLDPDHPTTDPQICSPLPTRRRRRRFQRPSKRKPARTRPQTRQNIRIPLTIAPQFLRPISPPVPSSIAPFAPTLPSTSVNCMPTSAFLDPKHISLSNSSQIPAPHTSTYPISNPPPSYPHTHAVRFPRCGHISLKHVYRRFPRSRTKLCICPNIPAVLPKIFFTNTNDGPTEKPQNYDMIRTARIVGAGMELEIDETGICDNCVRDGRKSKGSKSQTSGSRLGAWSSVSSLD